ncbi:hypothetical protein BGZ81_010115 [Podila clonocystis]|nr:hypothetical protein BGZ81_010115 [Podila clonocystis]
MFRMYAYVIPDRAIQAALPVVYSLGSALTLVYLSRKPVHLDQYEALRTDDDLDQETSETNIGSHVPSETESTVVDQVQAQYQAQRSSGMTINLARLGLTAVQLGLALFSIVLLRSSTDHRHRHGETQTDRLSTLNESAQALSWAYALALAFVHIIRPAVSHQFWIRPQLDLFYVLQFTLSSIHLYRTDVFDEPASKWPLWLKLDTLTWATGLLLIVVTLTTRPYQPPTPLKKHTPGTVPRLDSAEYSSSIAGRLFYSYINPLIFLGYKRSVQDVDLPNLEVSDFSWSTNHQHYLVKLAKKGSFSRTLLTTLKGGFFVQFLWSLPWCFFANVSPYCLNKILQYIECQDCGPPTAANYMYVFGLLIAALGESLSMQTALHQGRRIYMHAVSICSAEVFTKSLHRKDAATHEGKNDNGDAKKQGTLNITNLIAVDLKKMDQPFGYAFYMYGYPIQFVIAAYQLYQVLGYASLVGIAFMFAAYPIPAKLYAMIKELFKDIMSTKDERMDILNEMLSAIRIVKFFGWESKFEEKITTARNKELEHTRASYRQIVLANLIWVVMPVLNIIVVLLAYTKLFGHDISASKIFTTIALYNIMRSAVNSLPWTIKSTMQAVVSLDRINKYLQEEELPRDTVVTKLDGKAHASHPVIGFQDATFVWPNKENEKVATKPVEKKLSWYQKVKGKFVKSPPVVEEPAAEPEAVQERFKLKNINADFPVGKLSLIVGATGAGKSALLLALLGELERVGGSVYLPRLDYTQGSSKKRGSGIAYVAQTAWLQNTTIRDNILFGREFDQDRYDAVVEGCALSTDFEILEAGDATEIGEKGITLSGGQKQRVSLARAIYSAADVLLLDDCLSAVDTHTGKQLFQTLTGPLLYGRTVLMATHQVQLTLNAASLVVVLERGEILGSGTPEVVINNGWVDNVTYFQTPSGDDSEVSTLKDEERAQKSKKVPKKKVVSKLTEDEKKEEGAVAWPVYRTYLNASGGWMFWVVIITLFLTRQLFDISQSAWLAVWANKASDVGSLTIRTFHAATSEPGMLPLSSTFRVGGHSGKHDVVTMSLFGMGTPESANVEFYLGVYILLSILTIILVAVTNLYTILVGLRASRVLHERLLHKIIRAKVRFYDTTPMGRIANRFSSDVSTVDEEVSTGINNQFNSMVNVIGIIFVITVSMPAFLIPAVFIVAIYSVIGGLYIPVSRDLKRLNSISRSPILNHFQETLAGLATIRAYGFERQFQSKNLSTLDDNNRSYFLLWTVNRWLHWRVDVAGALVSFITGFLILQNWDTIAPGWAALSLTYALMFNFSIVWVIRNFAQNEMNMNSVERISEYMDLEEEPAAIIEGSRPPASWPHAGEIVVDHLVLKYALNTPAVIKDVSFRIKAGEKVGIVGRTGSGKSTFAISLFRFMDPTSGSITIDGIDITKIGLLDLRSNLTIIPQDPVLFKGTLRSNLDPFGEREDKDLWEALRRSHLIPASAAPSKRTSLDISDIGASDTPAKTPTGSIKGSVSGNSDIVDPSKITLDTPVKENGSNFSQGQRQLIALARALVRQSKIIIMDEATASVDFDTDLKIQGTIRQEMSESTIITIAHRIRTIADFDRVLVMNAGEVAEFDKPLTLMRQEDSLFRSMCERSSEFDALIAIAEEKERRDESVRQ